MNALEADMRERIISLAEENKRLKTEIKHKNQLWKSAFRAYKNLKKKVENKLFPVEFLDVGRTIIPDMPDFKNNVVYKFLIPWQKVKEYMLKKYKRGEK